MIILIFITFVAHFRGVSSTCQLMNMNRSQSGSWTGPCRVSCSKYIKNIDSYCLINMYRNYEYQKTMNEVYLNIDDLVVVDHENPFVNIKHIYEKVVYLSINGGNMMSIPLELYSLSNLENLIIINSLKLINFNRLGHLKQLNSINASHNIISDVETGIDTSVYINSVKSIDLSFNSIDFLPANSFRHYSNLLFLDLSYNLLTRFDILTFEGLTHLETFNVSHNHLTEIGHSFARFINLNYLKLQNNNLSNISNINFVTLGNVTVLNISSNHIDLLEDESFYGLKNIRILDMSRNKLKIIKKNLLSKNSDLESLILSNNSIEQIEDYSFYSTRITDFYLNDNLLQGYINRGTFAGIKVTELNLFGERLEELSDNAFSSLGTTLQSLNLSSNYISKISNSSFISLINLITLDVSNNKITTLDFDKRDLRSTSVFYINHNYIDKISGYTFSGMVSLVKLDLSFNKIIKIELDSFSELKNLEEIILNDNILSESLPINTFSMMNKLQCLNIMNTKLPMIRNGSFTGTYSIKHLNLSSNSLLNIEYNGFKGMESVEEIDLSYNILDDFFINTSYINNIKGLYLNNNRLQNITVNTFGYLKKMEILNLAFNNIVVFDSKGLQMLSKISTLNLSNNPAMEIHANMFVHLHFLSEVSLNNITKPFYFSVTEKISMKTIFLSHCNIVNVNMVELYEIRNLMKADLSSNKIIYLDKESFKNMTTLNWLDLSFNIIDYIKPGVFLDTNAITYLNLQGNKLTSVEFGVFDGLYNLRILNLSFNQIHAFSVDLLHGIPLLTHLLLDNNYISELSINDFATEHLEKLSIGGNLIHCDSLISLLKQNHTNTIITAEVADFHTENVKGISCIAFSKRNKIINSNVDTNATVHTINKTVENINRLTAMLDTNVRITNDAVVKLSNDLIEIFNKTQTASSDHWGRVLLNMTDNLLSDIKNVSTMQNNITYSLMLSLIQKNNDALTNPWEKLILSLNNNFNLYLKNISQMYSNQVVTKTTYTQLATKNNKDVSNSLPRTDAVISMYYEIKILLYLMTVFTGSIAIFNILTFIKKHIYTSRSIVISDNISNPIHALPNIMEMI